MSGENTVRPSLIPKVTLLVFLFLIAGIGSIQWLSAHNQMRFARVYDNISTGDTKANVERLLEKNRMTYTYEDGSTTSLFTELWIGIDNTLFMDVDFDEDGCVVAKEAYDSGIFIGLF